MARADWGVDRDQHWRIVVGLTVANGPKTTLSRRPERAKPRTIEVVAHLERVLAVGVDVFVPAR